MDVINCPGVQYTESLTEFAKSLNDLRSANAFVFYQAQRNVIVNYLAINYLTTDHFKSGMEKWVSKHEEK